MGYLVEVLFVPFARAQHLLADLFGVRPARGAVVGWVQQAAGTLEWVETAIKAALRRARAHVASTDLLTHYAIHAQPGSAATDAVGILPGFTGVSLHDGWAGYHACTTCRYALCNVHHMRELTFLEEEFHQAWAKDLKELLQEMRTSADQAHRQGQHRLAAKQRDILLTRYCDLLAAGLAANTPPALRRRPGPRGRLAQSSARNLLEQLALR